ncbi:hypothetical protein ACFE04_021334 [Oxalis oulophora]
MAESLHFSDFALDHRLLVISTERLSQRRKKGIFRYDNRWHRMEGCKSLIKDVWSAGWPAQNMFECLKKLDLCRRNLVLWSKKHPSNFAILIKDKKDQIDKLFLKLPGSGIADRILGLQKECPPRDPITDVHPEMLISVENPLEVQTLSRYSPRGHHLGVLDHDDMSKGSY